MDNNFEPVAKATAVPRTEIRILLVYIGVLVAFAVLQGVLGSLLATDTWTALQQNTYQSTLNLFIYVIMTIVMLRVAKIYFFNNQWPLFIVRPRFSYGMVLLTLYLMLGFNLILNQWFLKFDLSGISANESAIRTMLQSSWYNALMVFFMIVVFAPIVEELVFRKGFYQLIARRFGHLAAIFLNALPFALIHMLTELDNVVFIIPYYGMGIMLSFGYYYSGRLILVPIVAHSVMNLITFFAILFLF